VTRRRFAVLLLTHAAAALIGFAAGIYWLPILIAPKAPSAAEATAAAAGAQYAGQFRKDLKGSDSFHWGEGTVSIGRDRVSLSGRLAPGPDYKLYFSPEFVDTKEGFLQVKERSARVADIRTFENFILPLPASFDVARYNTVVVWCETFSMFISAAKYR
jgi:hypothetical protein